MFVTKDGKVVTPKSDSILPSITRRSLLYVAKEYLGLEVEEREVIKPILRGDEEGHIVTAQKIRGRKKAVETLVKIYEEKAVDPQNRQVAITHGDCPEEAQLLAERICAVAKPKELLVCPHEPFTGSHVGPGMLAVFFFGNGR